MLVLVMWNAEIFLTIITIMFCNKISNKFFHFKFFHADCLIKEEHKAGQSLNMSRLCIFCSKQ